MPGARHKRKCEGFCVCVVRHVMSLNSVQSFVIDNCNGPTIENGLNNVCLHPLSRTFIFKMLMRSTVFPFSVILKSVLKSLIYPSLNCYRQSVSILLIVEPLSVLSVRNKNQSLDVVLSFLFLVFNFFNEIYKECLVHFIVRLIWQ